MIAAAVLWLEPSAAPFTRSAFISAAYRTCTGRRRGPALHRGRKLPDTLRFGKLPVVLLGVATQRDPGHGGTPRVRFNCIHTDLNANGGYNVRTPGRLSSRDHVNLWATFDTSRGADDWPNV